MLHLLELELVDGYGEHSEYYYYLCECDSPIIDGTDNLTDAALNNLHVRYPNEKRICNSGYHHWRIFKSGQWDVIWLETMYDRVLHLLKALREEGVKI